MNASIMRMAFVASALLALPLVADAKLSSSGGSSVQFTAAGPAGMSIVGKTSELSVADDGQSVTVKVPLATLNSGIALRDKHMKEKYLQVGSYPDAELSVARSALKFPSGTPTSGSAQGTMKLHGKTKSVTFNYTAAPAGAKIQVNGSVHLDVRDYAIEIPNYMGVTVKPDVDVTVQFTATEG